MSRFHNSKDSEALAILWHKIGVVISGMSILVAIGGLSWHLWAVKQHEKHIEELEYDH